MKPKIWRSFGWCETHHKHLYVSRKVAKRVCGTGHRGEHKSAFQCEVNEGLWHIGGLSQSIIAGKYSRDQVYRNVA